MHLIARESPVRSLVLISGNGGLGRLGWDRNLQSEKGAKMRSVILHRGRRYSSVEPPIGKFGKTYQE